MELAEVRVVAPPVNSAALVIGDFPLLLLPYLTLAFQWYFLFFFIKGGNKR